MTEKEKKRIDRLIRANTELLKRIELLRDEIENLKKERDYWEKDRNEINSMWTRRYNQLKTK